MRREKLVKLYFREGSSDKVYEVELCMAGEGEYLVNFRYGRRGSRLREGTKTAFPESLQSAQKVFDKLVAEKKAKGYRAVDEEGTEPPVEEHLEPPAPVESGITLVIHESLIRKTLKSLRESTSRPGQWKLSRVIWRVGELRLREAVPNLIELAGQAERFHRYSTIWALGRCGDSRAVPVLRRLLASGELVPEQHRIALEALRVTLPEKQKEEFHAEMRLLLPGEMQDTDTLAEEVAKAIQEKTTDFAWLHTLYLLVDAIPGARELVYAAALELPIKPGTFKILRHLFKAAEFRMDAEIFGVLAHRFEKTPEYFNGDWGIGWVNGMHRSVKTAEECARPNSRLAFSSKTRTYLRRRVMRTLSRAGKAGDIEGFITLATGTLLAYSDEDAKPPWAETVGSWDRVTRQYVSYQRHYDAFCEYHGFNFLLYGNSPRFQQNQRRWRCSPDYKPGDPPPDTREEAFPEMWDYAPDAIAHLLNQSTCERVHEFAVKVWRANPAFLKTADVPLLVALLGKPYAVTTTLGLDLAKELYEPANPDHAIVIALSRADLKEARLLAMNWISQGRDALLSSDVFLTDLIVNPHADIQEFAAEIMGSYLLDISRQESVIQRVITALLDLDSMDEHISVIAEFAGGLLLKIAPAKSKTVAFEVIARLLLHEHAQVQVCGAEFLLQHECPIEDIPSELIEDLLASDHPAVRRIGLKVLERFSDSDLAKRYEILASFCISDKADMREAVRPIIERLARGRSDFAREMVGQFYPILTRKEQYEGLHQDVFLLLSGPLRDHLREIPNQHVLRLLDSKYLEAQKLGLLLLKKFIDLASHPMSVIAPLGGHDFLEVRSYIREYLLAHPDHPRREKEDALRLFETDWDDTRKFACTYFSDIFSESDWTPELLISLCDSVRVDVQDFGKDRITEFFNHEDGPSYLLALSQHPTVELQDFASNYLERFAAGEQERLLALEPFLITVLSQVNRGRVAKKRVIRFLENEALSRKEGAAVAMRIFTRQSATMAIGDRAACIQAMARIKRAWTDLEHPFNHSPHGENSVKSVLTNSTS